MGLVFFVFGAASVPFGGELPGGQLKIQVGLDTDDSRAVAARLWGLDALAARYRLVLTQTQGLTAQAGRQASGAAAFRAFAAATLPVYEATADDPDLPADLLPADWPGDQLAGVLGHAMRAFHPFINDYLVAITGA